MLNVASGGCKEGSLKWLKIYLFKIILCVKMCLSRQSRNIYLQSQYKEASLVYLSNRHLTHTHSLSLIGLEPYHIWCFVACTIIYPALFNVTKISSETLYLIADYYFIMSFLYDLPNPLVLIYFYR